MPIATQLSEIFNALGDGLFVASADGRYINVNPAGCEMLGYTRDELLELCLPDVVDESEWPRLPATLEEMSDGQVRRGEWLFRRKDGSTFVGELVGGRLPDGRYQSIVRDVSERREREREEQMLRHEATHRTKNILAVVQAVLRQTTTYEPENFVEKFQERIAALSASHDLFVKSAWGEISLEALVRAQLKPFLTAGKERLGVNGPKVRLAPAAAQSLGMALHEMATNAAKYGAFSGETGKVLINWKVDESQAPATFTMKWQEQGGPPVTAPERTGFGTRMIVRMIEQALRGKTQLLYDPDGMSWKIECQLSSLAGQ